VVELARLLQDAAGSSVDVVFAPRRAGEQQESFLTVDKARDVLGWTPEVSLADGLARTFAWAEAVSAAQRS
jgi:UDP-glucose 4-epimerase